jgi:chromosomal replication initiator protein
MTLWDRILTTLQPKMNSQSFNTWMRPTHQIAHDGTTLDVEVPSGLFAEWIHKNYLPLIQESVRELDEGHLNLRFSARDGVPSREAGSQQQAGALRAPSRTPPAPFSSGNGPYGAALHAAHTAPPGRPGGPVRDTSSRAPGARRPAGNGAETLAPTTSYAEPSRPGGVSDPARPAAANGNGMIHRYTFDSFVVSSCNQFAHAAAVAVAEQPSLAYNPLFVYGGVGLGKTHLMHAVGNRIGRSLPGLRILYISAETFMSELINAIRIDRTPDFKGRYRGVDVLMIDDIQFLAGKERTQEEFFHTFNALYEAQKQIIITSDCPPRDIPTLEERLRSRFEWGLIADIQPPDLETKVAILRKKAEAENIVLQEDVTLFIASRVRSNIRELEGSLIRLMAFSSLSGRHIDLEMARETLRDLIDDRPRSIGVEPIKKAIAAHYGIKLLELKSRNNSKHIAFPRQVAMYVCKQLTGKSLPALGAQFGGKHHTTVIHAIRKIEAMRERDREFDRLVSGFLEQFK